MQLIAENLSARRGAELIFEGISFRLKSGESLIVTGANGSGKSTLLRVIAGLLPDAGRVLWQSPDGDPHMRVAEACHYLGHRNAMKPELTVAENLSFWQNFLGDAAGGEGLPIGEAVEAMNLSGILHLPFGYLSAGQQRRIAFAKLLVAYRPIWILDEPTAALDVNAEGIFASLIRNHSAAGGIAVIATHHALEIEGVQEIRMRGTQA